MALQPPNGDNKYCFAHIWNYAVIQFSMTIQSLLRWFLHNWIYFALVCNRNIYSRVNILFPLRCRSLGSSLLWLITSEVTWYSKEYSDILLRFSLLSELSSHILISMVFVSFWDLRPFFGLTLHPPDELQQSETGRGLSIFHPYSPL